MEVSYLFSLQKNAFCYIIILAFCKEVILMAYISNEVMNEIRNKTDIVDVISKYVNLTKKGKIILVFVLFMMIILLV